MAVERVIFYSVRCDRGKLCVDCRMSRLQKRNTCLEIGNLKTVWTSEAIPCVLWVAAVCVFGF